MITDSCFDAYVETALWSSVDDDCNPLDKEYSAESIHPDTLARMRADLDDFMDANLADIESADVKTLKYDRYERAAHDFWLTRNGHGAGFWDGDWSKSEADRLTVSAKAYGLFDLIVGDDGMIHGC